MTTRSPLRLFALALVMLTAAGCASAEVRAQCPNWSLLYGCGPGYTGPPRPRVTAEEIQEREYPTNVAIVDGRVLHPVTGMTVDCELMAPFEKRLADLGNPVKALFLYGMWGDHAMFEIRGWKGYAFGVHDGHVRQGVAMSRACRELQQPPDPNAPAWCRAPNLEFRDGQCVTRAP